MRIFDIVCGFTNILRREALPCQTRVFGERGGKCAPNLYECQYANYCKLLHLISCVDLLRINVAVNDAFGMRRIESIGNFDGDREKSFRFHWTPRNSVL